MSDIHIDHQISAADSIHIDDDNSNLADALCFSALFSDDVSVGSADNEKEAGGLRVIEDKDDDGDGGNSTGYIKSKFWDVGKS